MRLFLSLALLNTFVFAAFDFQGHVGVESQAFLIVPKEKHKNNFTAYEQLEISYSHDAMTVATRLYAQQDYYDMQGDEENRRTFARIDELYGLIEFDEDALFGGRNIRFWGALEARNIVDGFNTQDLRNDLFNPDKMGAWNLAYSHYTDSGEFSLIIKLYEEEQKLAGQPYVYYFFPPFVSYDERLQSEASLYRPTLYLSYSGTTESEIAIDYAVILQHGYDSQRYFKSDGPLNGTPVTFQEHAYLVNKVMTYNTAVIDATLIKLEALYTDVIDDEQISDYWHLGIGVEYTLNFETLDGDLGLIGEYYRYETLDSEKYSDLELFETFQNDLFLGLRYSFNDPDDSTLLGGVIADIEYDEQAYYLEYESRFAESFKVNFDYRYIEPSSSDMTAYALLKRHERIGLKVAYFF
ncbi:MAG: hypothetical protein U9N52_12965 [Campylobacterota bacterium]|nr:hypothetical protein [Campylobacterota bacterium]